MKLTYGYLKNKMVPIFSLIDEVLLLKDDFSEIKTACVFPGESLKDKSAQEAILVLADMLAVPKKLQLLEIMLDNLKEDKDKVDSFINDKTNSNYKDDEDYKPNELINIDEACRIKKMFVRFVHLCDALNDLKLQTLPAEYIASEIKSMDPLVAALTSHIHQLTDPDQAEVLALSVVEEAKSEAVISPPRAPSSPVRTLFNNPEITPPEITPGDNLFQTMMNRNA